MSAKPDNKNPNLNALLSGLMRHAGQGQSNDWYHSYNYPETVSFYPEQLIACARSALYAKAIVEGTVYEVEKSTADNSVEGDYLDRGNLEVLVKSFDGRLVYEFDKILQHGSCGLFYVFGDGAIYVRCGKSRLARMNNISIHLVTLDKNKVELFNKHYKSCLKFNTANEKGPIMR